MKKYNESLTDEVKELIDVLEKHWRATFNNNLYVSNRAGLKASLTIIEKRALELENHCEKQYAEIQRNTEFIRKLETNQNQKAIGCLEELNEKLTDIIIAETEDISDFKFGQALERISTSFYELLKNKIKELEKQDE